jgi:hypothetical protein
MKCSMTGQENVTAWTGLAVYLSNKFYRCVPWMQYIVVSSPSCQTKDCTIGICSFSNKYVAIGSKSKRNQHNVSEWSNMFTNRLFSQRSSTINTQQKHAGLVQASITIISCTDGILCNSKCDIDHFDRECHLNYCQHFESVIHKLVTFRSSRKPLDHMELSWMVFDMLRDFNKYILSQWYLVHTIFVLWEETVPRENHHSATRHWQMLSYKVILCIHHNWEFNL